MRRTISAMLLLVGCSTSDDARRAESAPAAPVESSAEATAGSEPAAAAPVEPPEPQPKPARDENDPQWHAALAMVARFYPSWGRVDDELRFAPGLCRMQMPGRARFTASDDEGSHGGEKLYSVFALDPVAYGAPPTEGGSIGLHSGARGILGNPLHAGSLPTGAGGEVFDLRTLAQVLVKESFRPEERTRPPADSWADHQRRLAPAVRGGHTYYAGEPLGLYVMMRMRDADTPGTDAGWVYGTIAPDGTITASGRVRSCMSCHVDAPHDRWFGLPSYSHFE